MSKDLLKEIDLNLNPDNFFKSLDKSLEEDENEESAPDYSFLSMEEISQREFPKDQYIIEGLIPRDGITCIGGLPATMKSYFSNYLATCIADDKKVLDKYKTSACNILFIDKENKLSRIKDRFERLGLLKRKNIYFLESNFLVDQENDLGAVCAFIKDHKIGLTIIDTLVRIHQMEENSASEMNKVYQGLHEMQLAGSAVCFLHHFNKRGSFGGDVDVRDQLRGSGDILAMVDSYIALSRKENFIQVEQAKSRDDGMLPRFLMDVYFDKTATTFSYAKEVEDEERIKTIILEDEIIKMLGEGSVTRKTIINTFDKSHSLSSIDRAIGELRKRGEIISSKVYGKDSFYSIKKKDLFHKEDD